jgi:hypothetical protein
MRHFTKGEDQFLRENYLTIPTKRMSAILGRADSVARQRMKILGLKVPADIIAQFRAESQIKAGNVPFNKGRKLAEWMSRKSIAASKAGRFKPGGLPATTLYNGCITIRTDNRGVKSKWIRTSKARWVPLARFKWAKKHGRIKRGIKIIHKDGNAMNCNLSNLLALTAGQLMKRNSYHNYPKPLARLVQLRGALNRQINKHVKKLNNEK